MKRHLYGIRLLMAILILTLISNCYPAPRPVVREADSRSGLMALLKDICEWTVRVDLGSGKLDIEDRRRTSIFINSNLARVLLAGYEIFNDGRYLDEALAWFDQLVQLQQVTLSAAGDTVGYWGDFSPRGNIYLGDAGTSATALAGAVRFTEGHRKQNYIRCLERYARFVQYGCADDPQGKGRGGSPGWIISEGSDRGAMGAGYYRGQLSLAPYTISTSVAGAGFFSALYTLTRDPQFIRIAEDAGRWLLNQREPDGYMPYVLHKKMLEDWPVNTMSYFSDGLVGLYRRSENAQLKADIAQSITRNLQWLLNHQRENGTWGDLRSPDQQRSQGAINLMILYYSEISPEKLVLDGIEKNYQFFLNRKNVRRFGVMELPISTGFVGLAMAEILEPGITYRTR
ncbi:hypothetical protein JXO59_06980 [candidate division KSB1 bacterium]|nr:hypothetical protein [candidate division KSB1 bacterium]